LSKVVTVDFQGTVSGPRSHIDLKIDSGSYVPVASPRTITGLSDGPHTIYLKAVNQAGKADPTPAKWTFTVEDDGRIICLEGAGGQQQQQGCDPCPPESCQIIGPVNDTGGPSGGGGSNGGGIDEPPTLEEPILDNENDTTGKRIIGEEGALRLPFVMFGDRVSARSLTALSR
jgi:hypothetical protein